MLNIYRRCKQSEDDTETSQDCWSNIPEEQAWQSLSCRDDQDIAVSVGQTVVKKRRGGR